MDQRIQKPAAPPAKSATTPPTSPSRAMLKASACLLALADPTSVQKVSPDCVEAEVECDAKGVCVVTTKVTDC